jgi:hypothetical protein
MGNAMYKDLIGPYLIVGQNKSEPDMRLHCLTMTDPVTGWFELAEIPAKTADVVMDILELMAKKIPKTYHGFTRSWQRIHG